MKIKPRLLSGFSLVEVIIATSVILVFLLALVGSYNVYLKISLENIRKVQATFLAEEGIEAIKIIRDTSWDTGILPLLPATVYYFSWNGGAWAPTTTPIFVDSRFERSFTVEDAYRDSSGDIVPAGGILDSDTRKINISVKWFENNATSTKTIETYITNLFDN